MYDMDQIKEKVILVGVDTGSEDSVESSLDELAELARTAGAEVAGRLIQAKELDRLQSYLSESEDCFRRLQALPAAYRTEVQRWLDTALDFCVQARCALENRQKGAPVRAVLQPLCRYLTRKEDVMKEEAEQLLLLLAE